MRKGTPSMPRRKGKPSANTGNTTYLCSECGETAVNRPPTRDLTPYSAHGMPRPSWSHEDGTPLCPVMGPDGYQPANPRRR